MTVEPDVPALLERRRAVVEERLGPLLDELLRGAPAAVSEPIRYAVDAGGKRLRPILCLAAYEAAGGRGPTEGGVFDVACAIELLHTYSLVHDDLPSMDDDDLRRGRATTHRVFGAGAATVAGAALIPLAMRAALRGTRALRVPSADAAAVVRALAVAAGAAGMVGGQALDLAAEGEEVDLAALEGIHRRKTGALLAASLKVGGMAAGAPATVVSALAACGDAIGLAFQIADDVLDVAGRSELTGKAGGRDAELGKATFPAVLGLEGARARAEAEVASALAALPAASLDSPELEALARYAVRRER